MKGDLVLAFWRADRREGAYFEGRRLTVELIKRDWDLAERYWSQQLSACVANFAAQHRRGKV